VFEPFQRAGQQRGTIEGTGIGLAIGKRLAELWVAGSWT
jgi:signal transduction histidine kinase